MATAYGYDLVGNLASVTDAEGRVTSFETDDMGRVTKAVSPDTGTTRYAYDAAGNLTQKSDAAGSLITSAYDAQNRLTSIAAAGQTTAFTYDETDVSNGKGRLQVNGICHRCAERCRLDGGPNLSDVVLADNHSGCMRSLACPRLDLHRFPLRTSQRTVSARVLG